MRKGYIYSLICPLENRIRYIGKTVNNPLKRLSRHKKDAKSEKISHKISWLKKLDGLGLLESLEIKIVEECDINKIDEREIYWISKIPDLVNTTPGGECGSLNYKHTESAKNKISESAKRGYKMSDEGKKNIGIAQIGNKKRLGKKHKRESLIRMSNSIKESFKNGRKIHNAKNVYQYDIELNFIKKWESGELASKELGIPQSSISLCANGLRKKAGNFIWKYGKMDNSGEENLPK